MQMPADSANPIDVRRRSLDAVKDAPGQDPGRFVPLGTFTCRISQWAMLILIVFFALQVFSPLRLNTDAVILLSMAESAAHGDGFADHGEKTVFPPGYPALVALLLKMGFGNSSTIIALNLILLLAGLFAAHHLLRDGFFAQGTIAINLCSLFLLSYVVVKHFTIPLTDAAFFGSAMCCLAMTSHASTLRWGHRLVAFVAASWALVIVSIAIRRVGVALIPAFVLMVISRSEIRGFLRDIPTRTKWIVAALLTGASVGTVLLVAATSTLSDLAGVVSTSRLSHVMFKIVTYRLTELGELAVNVPSSKLPAMTRSFVPWIGLVLFLLTLGGLLTRRRHIGSVEVFFGSYLGVLFLWPFYDARFWLPVIPLVIGYSGLTIRRATKYGLIKAAVAIYCTVFAILGVASLAYSTRITFAGSKFPEIYGDGSLRPSYCMAFQSCSDTIQTDKVDPKVLHLLRTYR